MAPEIVLGEDYSEAVDIYSFGIVLSELQTRQLPFHDARSGSGAPLQDITIAHEIATGCLKPSFGENCPSSIAKVAHACLQFDPMLRPSAKEVHNIFCTVVRQELIELKL